MAEHKSSAQDSSAQTHRARLFDIRNFIAALLGIYGVVLLLVGLFGTTDADIAKAVGVNVNVWTGIALIIAAALLGAWARLRPVIVPAEHDES
jgi:hypothetical protein